ncbi:AAA family ATPase [Tardiphaga sp. P5_C7]
MSILLGVTGYSGAGKTTAIDYVSERTGAERIYVGQLVSDEVLRRGLPPGADSDREVRVKLRELHGMAGLAILAAPAVQISIDRGKRVIIDAVCCLEEIEFYRERFDLTAPLISIEASFDIRAQRTATRPTKPMSAKELRERDELEVNKFRTDLAILAATTSIDNSGDLSKLREQLETGVCPLVVGS